MAVETKHDYSKISTNTDTFFDRDWVKTCFMITDEDALNNGEYGNWIRANRYASSADNKWTSTVPGMSIAVNPKPQFTRYADIRNKGVLKYRPDVEVSSDPDKAGHPFGLGLGRYYSEAIDDNQQRIFLRFGTPRYMSMLMWITASFDVHRAALANRGKVTSLMLSLVDVASKAFTFVAAPFLVMGKLLLTLALQPDRFMSVSDDMHSYWATVENILNSFIVRRTMIPFFQAGPSETEEEDDNSVISGLKQKAIDKVKETTEGKGILESAADKLTNFIGDSTTRADNTMNQEMRPGPSFVRSLNELIPDVIEPTTGRIRVQALALRGQIANNRYHLKQIELNESYNLSKDFTGYPITGETSHDTLFSNKKGDTTFFLKWLFKGAAERLGVTSGDTGSEGADGDNDDDVSNSMNHNPMHLTPNGTPLNPLTPPEEPVEEPDSSSEVPDDHEDEREGSVEGEIDPDVARQEAIEKNLKDRSEQLNKYGSWILSEFTEGAAFAVFNVNTTGSVGESFSNSHTGNPIESTFNAISAKTRSMMNNLKHVTSLPLVGEGLSFLGDATGIVLSNATLGLANPLLALAYGAKISLPKTWESSSVSLPKASYSVKLISPYGNAYSQLFNIYLPLSMLMAAALPRKTGLDSYTAPMYCQLWDRGRVNIPFGMFTDLSVTRGTSNLAFTRGGHPNAIDVDFSITDLNEIIAVDISSNNLVTRVMELFDPNLSDDAFTNYVNTVTGVDVYSMFYKTQGMRLKLAERAMALKAVTSMHPADLAAFTVNSVPLIGPIGKAIFGHSGAALTDLTRR